MGRRAKSNGTLLALAASEILMGPVSELRPIDPNISLGPGQSVPAHFVLQAPNADPTIKQIAAYAVAQTQGLATQLLTAGQFATKPNEVAAVVTQLSTRNTYPSHGSVIDCDEAIRLGLNVKRLMQDRAAIPYLCFTTAPRRSIRVSRCQKLMTHIIQPRQTTAAIVINVTDRNDIVSSAISGASLSL